MAPRIVDKAERRAHLLEAAVRVFARKGYHFTVMDDVAAEAGVSKGTLYLYFESRDKLFETIFTEYMAQWEADMEALVEGDASPLDKLRTLITSTLQSMAANPDVARAVLDFWAAGLHDHRQPLIDFKPYYAWYRTFIRHLLKAAVEEDLVRADYPPHTPSVFIGAIEGIFIQWLIDPEAVPIDQVGDQLMDIILHGLLVRADTERPVLP